MVTNDWCIIYCLWCTSHKHLVLSHPPKYIDPKHKIWHPLIYCSTYFQAHSHHITTSALFLLDESFFTWTTPNGWALWLFSLINYSCPESRLACIFCIVWCQQISIWDKQIERSIYLMKQVEKLFKIWWSEKEQGTQKIKILNWGTGDHRHSFHKNKRIRTHWELQGLNIFSYAKNLWAQTMAIICIYWNYFDMIRNLLLLTRYFVLQNRIIIHR